MSSMLQKKFVRTAMAAITVLLVCLLGAINIANVISVYRDASEMAQRLLETGGDPGEFRDPGEGRRSPFFRGMQFSRDRAFAERFFVVFFDKEERIARINTGQISSVDAEEAEEMAREALEEGRTKGVEDGFLYYVSPFQDSPWDGAEGTAVVFLDVSGRIASLTFVLAASLIAGIAAWILMFLLVRALSGRAIAPIAANIEKQKQFVTNAGHELKTPLAIILANTDALELYTGENKWTRNIRTQTVRLSGLMQNLLTLSRMDEEGFTLPMERVDLADLVWEKIQEFSESALGAEIGIAAQIDALTVQGNRDSLAQLLMILLDNAVKYTPKGGWIRISLTQEGGKACLIQSNTIEPGTMEEDPEKLFDRFYRADKARTQKSGGYGIGLSAARAIAQANRGSIDVMYEEEYNIVFIVKMML